MAGTPENHRLPGVEPLKELASKARALVHQASVNFDEQYGCGSMSCTIYDTAWVSMVTKTVDGEKQWLFTNSFRFLLRNQSGDGSWGASPHSQIDGILNTAAALLSVQKHTTEALQMRDLDPDDLRGCRDLAAASLARQLRTWNVAATRHVGFEMIVPVLLDLLEKENPTLCFPFDGREALMMINAAKLSRFRPELLYQSKTTATHSLEAFIGKIDFDKVQHHLVHGSMMGSPSSTAAYLMHVSRWDNDAESYLENAIDRAAGQGSGGVPSAYPSFFFEYTWVLSTLLRAGFSLSDLQSNGLTTMKGILNEAFDCGNGTIGFAPGFEPDADDTAKGILSLGMLGSCIGAENMLRSFEAENHFRTYPGERDPSFSANCNVLIALLHQSDVSRYSTQISKAVKFLCTYWWDSDARIKDKWNLCHLYPCLLLVEAFADLFIQIKHGSLALDLLESDMQSKVSITLFQACSRALLEQRNDGSWMGSIEPTAYGVMILCEARNICFFDDLRLEIIDSIHRGISFLKSATLEPKLPDLIWIEKVSFASPLLTEAYVLAAQKAAASPPNYISLGATLHSDARMEPMTMARYVHLFLETPLFSPLPNWQIRVSFLEAALFMPLLRARRLEVFPRKNMEKDSYFEIIPFTWTSCNNRSQTFASTSFLYDMMVISFLNYQADEFMEAVAGPAFRYNLGILRCLIDDLFASKDISKDGTVNWRRADNGGFDNRIGINFRDDSNLVSGLTVNGKSGDGSKPGGIPDIDMDTRKQYEGICTPLRRFVSHVLGHPSIAKASSWDRTTLTRELRTFLLAHVSQTEDNFRFGQDQGNANGRVYTSATTSFFQWVRTTSANHTSCPYSFAFVSCLISASLADGKDCFPSAREKYLAEAACRHLATMCRMYNDYGSVARDRVEWNLNSINFLEFNRTADVEVDKEEPKREALFTLAEYERTCLNVALGRLETEGHMVENGCAEHRDMNGGTTSQVWGLNSRKMEIWRMFCDVTDLYGQIYVLRDIASRMVPSK